MLTKELSSVIIKYMKSFTYASHPCQPVYIVKNDVMRFKGNSIINYLFNSVKLDLNEIDNNRLEQLDAKGED